MYKFEVNGKEFSMPTSWDEISLERYIELAKLEKTREGYKIPELYLLKLFEALMGVGEGELDELDIETMTDLSSKLAFVSEVPQWPNTRHINIEGVDYVFTPDLNKITMGEYISIKTLQDNTDEVEFIPYLLSIILRPGKEVNGVWVQDKFDTDGIDTRRELFMKQPVFSLIGPVNFFLSGKK